MSTLVDVPAGTEQARAGLHFTRVNCHRGPATDADTQLFLLIDGRHIADVWEAVPGSWSTTAGIAGYRTGFASAVDAEDAVIAAYHQLPVRADYEIDVLDGGQWSTVVIGRVGVDVDRLSVLGVTAREIATEFHALRNLPVRVTLWSTTAPTSRVTTYAEYRMEEPMSEEPGQPGHPGHPDHLTGDHSAPAGEAVTPPPAIDWSPLREGDRVWRVDPVTGHPQGLTIETFNEETVTGHLDFGPKVTLPLTDIHGQVFLLEDEAAKVLGAGGKAEWMNRELVRLAADPNTIVWVADLGNGRSQTEVWAAARTSEYEAAMRRALADPEQMVIGQYADGSPATWTPSFGELALPLRPQLDPQAQAIADKHRPPAPRPPQSD